MKKNKEERLEKQYQKNKEWWAERATKTQDNITNKNIKETEKQLIKYYQSTMEKILDNFENTYNKIFQRIAEGKEVTPADLYKLDSYWNLQIELKNELLKLGDKQAALLSKRFMKEYKEVYEALSIPSKPFFSGINEDTAEQMINQVWCADGKTWSSRVWANVDKLQEMLNEQLVHCVITGMQPAELKKALIEKFNVSFRSADMIVRTELAHIQTQAARNKYLDYGISEVEVFADKDERRCELCGKLHGKRYPIYAQMPVPVHPNCRCAIIPVVD